MPSPSLKRTVPLGMILDYSPPGATSPIRVRVKGYMPADTRRRSNPGDVYLVPQKGGARQAHRLPKELQHISVVEFWEKVNDGHLRIPEAGT